jgi:hypothetical protein
MHHVFGVYGLGIGELQCGSDITVGGLSSVGRYGKLEHQYDAHNHEN